ncbi:MAG: sarcosine oxidase subunit delta [Pseudomonadota bacterium]
MIRIRCPFCGERDHSEFTYGGDGSIVYPALDAPMEDWVKAVFERENPRGRQLETWHHTSGCRAWLLVERDTMTHEIFSVRLAHEGAGRVIEEGT